MEIFQYFWMTLNTFIFDYYHFLSYRVLVAFSTCALGSYSIGTNDRKQLKLRRIGGQESVRKIGDWATVKPVHNVHISVYIIGWMYVRSACLPSVCLHLDKFRPINVEYTQIPVTNFRLRFPDPHSSLLGSLLHRIYPNKLSGSLWHSFLYTGVFAKGQIFHIRMFFIRNVEKILAEIWPKIYFQSFSKVLCVYSDFPITIPIDSSPPAQLDKKNVTTQFKTITFSSSLEITWILHLHYMIILQIRQPYSERI